MHHVFVSYAREDVAAVDRLADALRRQGVSIWLDRREIPVSVQWREEAEAGMTGADLFLICSSPAWTVSGPCAEEYALASDKAKAVETVFLADQSPQDAAALVIAALRAISPDQRLHTEIAVQTGIWTRAHRSPAALPSRQFLRACNALVTRAQTVLSFDQLEFLRVANQRRRRARLRLSAIVASAVVLVLVLCMSGFLLPAINDKEAGQENTVSDLLGARFSSTDPYATLASLAQMVHDGQSYNQVRRQLVDALSAHVPAQSWTAGPVQLLGFGGGVSHTPTAVATNGVTVTATGAHSGTTATTLRALSRSSDGRVQVRTSPEKTVLSFSGGQLTMPPAAVSAVSADGRTALVVIGRHAKLYALPDTTPVTVTVPAHCCTAATVADGRAFLGTGDGHLVTFSAAQPSTAVAWHLPAVSPITALAISADGAQIAVTGATDGVVRLLSTDHPASQYALPAGPVSATAFSPDSRYLAVATGDTVVVFDATNGQRITGLVGSTGTIRDLAWSPDSATIWALAGTNRVVGWPWRVGTALVDNTDNAFVAVVGPIRDGRTAAVDRNGTITMIDSTASRIQTRIRTGAIGALSADWSPDGSVLAIGTSAHGVRLWHPNAPASTIATGCSVTGLAFDTDAHHLYTACGNQLRAYDPATGRLLASATVPSAVTTPVRVANGTVFIGDAAGDVLAFGADLSGTPVTVSGGCGPTLTGLAIDTSGRFAIAAGDDANDCGVELRKDAAGWQTTYVPAVSALGASAPAAALFGGNALAAFGRAEGTIDVWLPGTPNGGPAAAGTYHESADAVRGITYTADGHRLVIATADGLLDVLPGCPMCGSDANLATEADTIVAHARALGLYTG